MTNFLKTAVYSAVLGFAGYFSYHSLQSSNAVHTVDLQPQHTVMRRAVLQGPEKKTKLTELDDSFNWLDMDFSGEITEDDYSDDLTTFDDLSEDDVMQFRALDGMTNYYRNNKGIDGTQGRKAVSKFADWNKLPALLWGMNQAANVDNAPGGDLRSVNTQGNPSETSPD